MPRSKQDKFISTLSRLSAVDPLQFEAILRKKFQDRDFLAAIFDALVDGIIVLNPSLEVVLANAAAVKLLNVQRGQGLVGMRLGKLPLDDTVRKLISRYMLGEDRETSLEVELPGAEPTWLHISLHPLRATREDDGEQLLLVQLRDTTAWHQAEEQRRRAEYWKQMATLAAGLAHEIKNPLNSLQIHAQLLQRALHQKAKRSRSLEMQRQLQSIDIIVEEIARLGRVVNEFLSAVRPGRPMLQRANVNYHVERVVETFRPEAESRGVQLVLKLDYEIPPVEFDPNQLTQVLLNLLKNALEALTDTPDPFIEIRTELCENHYAISISDNGHGISADVLARVKEPFFTTKATGTGLGLAVVSRIVEEHGGLIDIRSDLRHGTTVTLRFPLDGRPLRLLEEAREASSTAPDGQKVFSVDNAPEETSASRQRHETRAQQ
jgi:signal transduction histidine kinase